MKLNSPAEMGRRLAFVIVAGATVAGSGLLFVGLLKTLAHGDLRALIAGASILGVLVAMRRWLESTFRFRELNFPLQSSQGAPNDFARPVEGLRFDEKLEELAALQARIVSLRAQGDRDPQAIWRIQEMRHRMTRLVESDARLRRHWDGTHRG